MSNDLLPTDHMEVDEKRHSTLSATTDGQTTAAPTPNQRSVNEDKEARIEDLNDGSNQSGSDLQKQPSAEEAEKQGEELARVESSLYPGPLKLIFVLVSVCLAVFLVRLQ